MGENENYHILVVEDDRILNEGIAFALRREGYLTHCASSLKEAGACLKQKMDLILLDINLPDGDGREFLEKTLALQHVPVVLLTARDSEEDMMEGFKSGCDDYITKPFSLPLLIMKIRAVLRRKAEPSRKYYLWGNIKYDFEAKSLRINEKEIDLTALERKLLEMFLENPGIVLTREQLLENIWDIDERFVEDKTLNVNIRRLREKIEHDPGRPEYIKTVFGIGYQWDEDEKK